MFTGFGRLKSTGKQRLSLMYPTTTSIRVLRPLLDRWLDARKKLDSGEWTLEQYEDWQATFPIAVPTEKSKATESDADSSGEMIKSGKHKRPRKPKKQ